MDTNIIYKQLTGVEIEKQQQIWDERGKGYYGEYLLFCELYKSISGNGKILMNLNVPAEGSKTTEIDLILIHETGLYVFEIKHYKGTIYGKDTDDIWTQYFKTVKNNTFKNPIHQNNYHILALQKLFPETPIHSCVVFTNSDCDLRITNSDEKIDICYLSNIVNTLERRFSSNENKYSMNDIDNIFSKLSVFSPMSEPVQISETEANFISWVQPIIDNLNNEKEKLKSNAKKLIKAKKITIVFSIIITIICISLSFAYCYGIIQKNNEELDKFKQNFLHIDEIGNEYINELNSYVSISDVSLTPLSNNAVTFTAKISMENDIYGISISENSKYIVMTTSGKVIEYDVFGEHLRYNPFFNMIYKSYDLEKAQFYGISNTNDISYIKITNINLFKANPQRTPVKNGLEIELYSK